MKNYLTIDTKSAVLITGSFVTILVISQLNWAYDHNDFSNISVRIALASLLGMAVGALYLFFSPPIIEKVTRLDKAEIIKNLTLIHIPVYLLWFYLLNLHLGIGFINSYLTAIVPLFSFLAILKLSTRHSLITKIHNQMPYIEISIFSSIIAITLTYFYYQDLKEFSNDAVVGIVKTLGLSLLFLNLPYNISFFFKYTSNEEQIPWYRSQALMTVLILSFTVLVGFLLQDNNYYLDILLSTCGYGFLFLTLCQYIYNGIGRKIFRVTFFLYSFFAFSLWIAAIIGNSNHSGPFYLKKIYLGTAGIDPIFHSGMSHMIQTYMIPSTGIDGLPYTSYHWGSHWAFAQLSKLFQITPFHFYELSYPVIFVSLFFYSMLLFMVELRNFYHIPKNAEPELFQYHTFTILSAACISFIPLSAPSLSVMTTGMGLDSWFVSQSYLVSVTINFLFVSLIISFWKKYNFKQQIEKIDILLLYLIFPLFTVSVGLSKTSTVLLVFSVITYLHIRLGIYKKIHFILSYMLSAFMFFIVLFFALPDSTVGISIEPLHYINSYIADPWKPFHFAFYYFWSFLFVYFSLKLNGIENGYFFKKAFLNKTTIGIEIIVIISFIGFLPGALIPVPGGSAAYFSGFQIWIAVALLMALTSQYNLRIGPRSVVLILFLMPFIYTVYNNGEMQFIEYRSKNAIFKNQSVDTTSPEYQILNLLDDLSRLPLSQKRETLLYIPKTNTAYWHLSKGDTTYRCKYVPFIAPALSGIAMINGLPEINCNAKNYGYNKYNFNADEQSDIDETSTSLCSKTLKKGFNYALRIDQNEQGFQQTILKCN